jgi:hypothetical protein
MPLCHDKMIPMLITSVFLKWIVTPILDLVELLLLTIGKSTFGVINAAQVKTKRRHLPCFICNSYTSSSIMQVNITSIDSLDLSFIVILEEERPKLRRNMNCEQFAALITSKVHVEACTSDVQIIVHHESVRTEVAALYRIDLQL